MADRIVYVQGLPVKAKDNGDGTYSLGNALTGRNVQPTLRTIRTTPLAAGASYTAPDLDLEGPPGIAAVAYSVATDNPLQIEIFARDGTENRAVAIVVMQPVASGVPSFIPPFRPLGRQHRVRLTNVATAAQTFLRVYEHQFTEITFFPQNLRALLAYNLAIRDTAVHGYATDPSYVFRMRRIPFGGGKVPIYVDNQHDQQVTVNVNLAVSDKMNALLGSVNVPAASKKVITNMDFPGIDVPSEEIYCSFQCATTPTTGILNAYIDTLVGGTA